MITTNEYKEFLTTKRSTFWLIKLLIQATLYPILSIIGSSIIFAVVLGWFQFDILFSLFFSLLVGLYTFYLVVSSYFFTHTDWIKSLSKNNEDMFVDSPDFISDDDDDEYSHFAFNPANGMPMLNDSIDIEGNPFGYDDDLFTDSCDFSDVFSDMSFNDDGFDDMFSTDDMFDNYDDIFHDSTFDL